MIIAATAPVTINAFVGPQLKGMAARGWETHIVSGRGELNQVVHDSATSSRVVPMTRAISPVRDVRSVVRLSRVMRDIDPDLVLAGTPKAALVALLAARIARVPVRVFHVRGARWESAHGLQRRLLQAADRLTAACATNLLCVSPSLAQRLVDARIVDSLPVVLGRGGSKGVDLHEFIPEPTYRFDPNSPRLGLLGRLSRDKGIEAALEVFEGVAKVNPDARLEVIGEVDQSQPLARSTLQRLDADPRIDWSRGLEPPQVARQMARWDLLVFTSCREGLPNAVIEAAACGVPTVGWRVTGVSDAVDHGRSGFLVAPADISSFIASALSALEDDRHEYLRQGALDLAKQFDSELILDLLLDYLDQLVEAPRSRTGSLSRGRTWSR